MLRRVTSVQKIRIESGFGIGLWDDVSLRQCGYDNTAVPARDRKHWATTEDLYATAGPEDHFLFAGNLFAAGGWDEPDAS